MRLSVNVNSESEAEVRLRLGGTKRSAVVMCLSHFLLINGMFRLGVAGGSCLRELPGQCKYVMLKKAVLDECVPPKQRPRCYGCLTGKTAGKQILHPAKNISACPCLF